MTPLLETIDQIARLIIGGMFIYSGSRILKKTDAVQKAILDYLPVPKAVVDILAAAVAPMLFGFGLLLASDTVPTIAAIVLLVLTLVFALVMGGAVARSLGHNYSSQNYSLRTYVALICVSVIIMGLLAVIATVPREITSLQLAGFVVVLVVMALGFFIQYSVLQRNAAQRSLKTSVH